MSDGLTEIGNAMCGIVLRVEREEGKCFRFANVEFEVPLKHSEGSLQMQLNVQIWSSGERSVPEVWIQELLP